MSANRVSSTDYDETGAARTSLYTANSLNQYTARAVPGWASVRGLADADATVAVNGNPAFMVGCAAGGPRSVAANEETAYFFGSDDFDNSATGGFAELEVSATKSDGTNDLVSVVTNKVFVPSANDIEAKSGVVRAGPDRFSTVPDAIGNVVSFVMGLPPIKWYKFTPMK